MIYLDNCATTKPRDEVIDAMVECLRNDFANPSSLHSFGHRVEKKIDDARSVIAKALNVLEKEIYFTSGGTESTNIALNGLIEKNKKYRKIITTKIEHSSVLDKLRSYRDKGYEIVEVSVDNKGMIDTDELYKSVDNNTSLISLFHVNNEIGSINNISDIIKKIREINKNVYVHVDGVQAFGKIKVDLKDLDCDTYSISSHKIYGPKGIGLLYIRDGIKINPLVLGGGQERNIRSGTENVPGIIGFGVAAKLMIENFEKENNLAKSLKEYLIENLKKFDDVVINTPNHSSNYITSVSFKDVRAEVLLHYLEQDEIYISTASACTSNGTKKSHVLEAMGLDSNYSSGTIRICTSKDITKDDIDEFISKLSKYIKEIRDIMRK